MELYSTYPQDFGTYPQDIHRLSTGEFIASVAAEAHNRQGPASWEKAHERKTPRRAGGAFVLMWAELRGLKALFANLPRANW